MPVPNDWDEDFEDGDVEAHYPEDFDDDEVWDELGLYQIDDEPFYPEPEELYYTEPDVWQQAHDFFDDDPPW